MLNTYLTFGFLAGISFLQAQSIELREAPPAVLPTLVDSNSPAFWSDGRFYLFTSTGAPVRLQGDSQFNVGAPQEVRLSAGFPQPVWFESVWKDPDGPLFLWYHHEVAANCPDSTLAVPEVGAAISFDDGATVTDLGIVLRSGDPEDCSARNGFFSSGHGDFSVIPDREQGFFYFFFSSYGGDVEGQGVAAARMAFSDRRQPAGAVRKLFQGQWSEPGLGGRLTPIFPASTAWQQENTDAFWGPSVHWNTYLQKYVMLLNRSCCSPGWPQEGVYLSINADVMNPLTWTPPLRIVPNGAWYPQVLGASFLESDTEASQTPRLYMRGFSGLELVFSNEAAPTPPPESSEVSSAAGSGSIR